VHFKYQLFCKDLDQFKKDLIKDTKINSHTLCELKSLTSLTFNEYFNLLLTNSLDKLISLTYSTFVFLIKYYKFFK